MLRSACEDLLIKFSMHDHYVTTFDRYLKNQVCITNSCGRYVISIPGLVLSRKSPSHREIDNTVPLIEQFLTKNKNKIDTYMDKFYQLKHIDLPEFPEECEITYKGLVIDYSQTGEFQETYTISPDLTLNFLDISFKAKETDGFKIAGNKKKLALVLDLEILTPYINMYKIYLEHSRVKQELEQALSDLNTCR
jgi:hypothetical protein